jgi:hypothetical protein
MQFEKMRYLNENKLPPTNIRFFYIIIDNNIENANKNITLKNASSSSKFSMQSCDVVQTFCAN